MGSCRWKDERQHWIEREAALLEHIQTLHVQLTTLATAAVPGALQQPTQVKVEMPAKLQQAGRSARQSMLEDSLDLEDFEDPIMGAGGRFVLFCKIPVDCHFWLRRAQAQPRQSLL